MVVVDSDIVRIEDRSTLYGKSVLNVFWYLIEVVTAGITLVDIMTEFRDIVTDAIAGIQTADLTHSRMIITNATNEVDIASTSTPIVGTDLTGGESMPSYVAASVRLFVPDQTTRRGGKRFAGIGEDRVDGNDLDLILLDEAAMEAALAIDLDITGAVEGEGVAKPIVVGRFPVTGHIDLSRFSLITVAGVIDEISSQVSRKVLT